MPYTKLRSKHH